MKDLALPERWQVDPETSDSRVRVVDMESLESEKSVQS
jgi:hypothetical protein